MQQLNLDRFIKAQERDYNTALSEIKSGKKKSHWVWYIFPQIKGLGHSETAQYYSIQNIDEARLFLDNKYLHNNLIEICGELLKLDTNDPLEVMGFPDNLKLCSSITLFHLIEPEEEIFKQVLKKYYNGELDTSTLTIIGRYHYANEVKEKWSNTNQYKEYEQKNKNRSKQEFENINNKFMNIFTELGSLKHLPIEDEKVQEKIKILQEFITDNYYNCTNETLKGLGQMYVNDERFKKSIDEAGGDGTAEFASQAIFVYCSKK